ncbi:MAG: ABC transporter permease [Dehalococcoidia bacterium]|nr:ABC transporter permease [Dehalococcoidia bacterium]
MNLQRIRVLLGKDLVRGPKNVIFIMAVVMPVLISVVITFLFGALAEPEPRLGIVDEGDSRLVGMLEELPSIETAVYGTAGELKEVVRAGHADIGIVLPDGLDEMITTGEPVEIETYIWGESLAQDRAMLGAALVAQIRELAGQEPPVVIDSIVLGEADIPWSDRMLPLIVLITIFIAGMLLPASLIIEEKERKTLQALVVTPTTAGEIFTSKALIGLFLSLFTGVVVLALNQAFSIQPALLIFVLALGGIMAAGLGVLMGIFVKDYTTLFTLWRPVGIFLFLPAFIYMFPQIPEWIATVFPTYYLVEPVMEISLRGGGWSEIATDVLIVVGLNALLLAVVAFAVRNARLYA